MEFIEQLKSAVDIVQVVGEHVRLRRVGSSVRYMGLCPFHNEKTASFSVHAHHQFYKCFGCGAGGDVIKFVMEMERMTFWEAVKYLAEKHGIPLPKRADFTDEETKRRAALFEMHEIAAALYRENLLGPAGQDARAYLGRRGVQSATAEEFNLGLSDRGGQQLARLLEKRGFAPAQMEEAGLVLRRNDGTGFYDRFRGRLMFPIHSEAGKIIGFGGRALAEGDEPKYLNSSETAIYRKSHVLYSLNRARKAIQDAGYSVLVEGYMDVIGVWSAGVKHVVATCGTALTPQQVQSMKRHATKLVVNFDPDAAGANATERSIQVLLEEGMHLKVLSLDGGLDPDEYVKEHGAEGYLAALDRARGYFHWLADRARTKFDLRTPDGRVAAFQFLLPAIQRMPDRLERLAVANDVAEYMRMEPGLVLDEFKRAATERREQRARPKEESSPDPDELLLLRALMDSPEVRAEVFPVLKDLDLSRLRAGKIFDAIVKAGEGGLDVTHSAVEARLEEAEQNLLARALFADGMGDSSASTEQAVACIRKLAAREMHGRKEELRRRISEAESGGNVSEAIRLTRELMAMDRS